MFQTLKQNLTQIFDKIKKTGALTEGQIDSAMRDIRIALLSADVSIQVVKHFIDNVSKRAKGQEVIKSISPGQMVIKIIHDEMVSLLSVDEQDSVLNLSTSPPANILIVGLQGSGKTTASAKLALKLKKQNKKVLLVSLDVYRPAAQEQLAILSRDIEVDSLEIIKDEKPIQIVDRAIGVSKSSGYDVVIYDSAGRLHIDDVMIKEVTTVKQMIQPSETLLIVDSMMGQDSITVAQAFHDALNVSGVILSRIDGDARGGAALSIRSTIGIAIKFLSTGEKATDFEAFDAQRIASRILDMGDVVSLVEQAADILDQDEADKLSKKLEKGKFDLEDYISQISNIQKLGGFSNILSMIPGLSKMTNKLGDTSGTEKLLIAQQSIVHSMTPRERRVPQLLNASRKKRVANGSGTSVQQVNQLLKQFKKISTAMKKFSTMDKSKLMRGGIDQLFS